MMRNMTRVATVTATSVTTTGCPQRRRGRRRRGNRQEGLGGDLSCLVLFLFFEVATAPQWREDTVLAEEDDNSTSTLFFGGVN